MLPLCYATPQLLSLFACRVFPNGTQSREKPEGPGASLLPAAAGVVPHVQGADREAVPQLGRGAGGPHQVQPEDEGEDQGGIPHRQHRRHPNRNGNSRSL